MADQEEARRLLAGWIRQQKKDGVERVVLDRDTLRKEAAPAVAAESPPVIEKPAEDSSPLEDLHRKIAACSSCGLAETRTQTVPGVGNSRAKLVFVGEAPGADEDRLGVPFVGRGGQLLDKILAAIDLRREDVYICNILKCRPPENRNPAADEILACSPFLRQQLEVLEPKIIVALGLFAAQWLTGQKKSLTKLRETGPHEYAGIRVYATYHPAALLRNPNWKRPAWDDFQAIRKEYDRQ